MKINSFSSTKKTFIYPGGTIHLASWACLLCGLVLIWLTLAGQFGLRTTKDLVLLISLAGLLPIFNGLYLEWTLRNQAGRIVVDDDGLHCTIPWWRERYFHWEDIREVRCIGRRFERQYSFWEVRGQNPKDRITFHWELKGYKQLLWLIRQHASQLQRFDPEPADLEPIKT